MKQVKVEEKFVEIPDGRIFVKIWRHQNAQNSKIPPVFLLHDSLGCVEMWRDFPAMICEQIQGTVIAYDRFGFGQSSARSELPNLQFIQEEAQCHFPKLRSILGIQEFVVFGHSVGGCMALHSAVNCPQNKAIIAESATIINEEITQQGIRNAEKMWSKPDQFSKLQKYHFLNASRVLRAWIDTWLSPDFAHWNMKDILPDIQPPVLILHGDRDEFTSLDGPLSIHKSVSGRSELQILKHLGHVPHRENAGLILDLTADFLKRLFPEN